MITYKYRGQGHYVTFVQGPSDLYIQTSSKLVKFHVESLWSGELKFVQMM